MSRKSKLLAAIKNNPKNIDFEDIKKLLEDVGYTCSNNGSSHYVFRKADLEHITIPFAKPIKAIGESKMKTSKISGKLVADYINLDYEIILRALTPEEGGGWFAYYKDFKGVMGDGETPEEAIKDIRVAFEAFIQNAIDNGDTIPMPSSHQPKSVRLNITIPEDELIIIDNFAKSHGMSRSGLIQAATKQYIRL